MTDSPTAERDLGRVEGKIDLVLQVFSRFESRMDTRDEAAESRLASRIKANDDRHKATEDRVSAVEKKILILVAGLVAVAGAYLGNAKQLLAMLVHLMAP